MVMRSHCSSSTIQARPTRRSITHSWNRPGRTTICFTSVRRRRNNSSRYLHFRLRDKRLQSLVKDLFRPSYGGNRNYTLMYTLGGLMVSSDDDMRPYALMEDSPESLGDDQVCRGRLYKVGEKGFTRKSFDILSSFLDVLGKKAGEAPANYERGEVLLDTAMDLETNTTKGLFDRELADRAARPRRRRCDREDGPDVPLGNQ